MPNITFEVLQKPIDERLIDASCIYWEIERNYFSQKTQDTIVVYRKSILYYLIKTACPFYTYESLAAKFGFLSHQPVIRAVEKISSHKDVYKQTANDLVQISKIAETLSAKFITTNIQLLQAI